MRTIVRLRVILLGVLAVAVLFVALHLTMNAQERTERRLRTANLVSAKIAANAAAHKAPSQ